MVRLSENFTLEELTYSDTARRLKIENRPGVKSVENLKQLVNNVLQPLRTWLGSPVLITSGYRSAMLNKKVGGVAQSQHQFGCAADFIVPNKSPKVIFDFIKNHLDFDQLLFEYDSKGNRWIHVSYNPDGNNRKQAIYNYKSS